MATPSRAMLDPQMAGLGGGMYALPPDVIQQNMMRQQLGMPAMSSPPMDPTLQYQLQLQAERQRMLDQQAAADAAQAAQQPPTGPMSPYQQLTGQGATAGAAPGQAVVRDLEGRGSALDYYLRLFGLRGGAQNSR